VLQWEVSLGHGTGYQLARWQVQYRCHPKWGVWGGSSVGDHPGSLDRLPARKVSGSICQFYRMRCVGCLFSGRFARATAQGAKSQGALLRKYGGFEQFFLWNSCPRVIEPGTTRRGGRFDTALNTMGCDGCFLSGRAVRATAPGTKRQGAMYQKQDSKRLKSQASRPSGPIAGGQQVRT
jgi:hypothetical protein